MNRPQRTPKPLLSVEETAILLGETRSTVYRAVKAGTLPLPMFLIGSRIRIPRSAVERLIAGEDPSQPVSIGLPVEQDGQPDSAPWFHLEVAEDSS
jgi:excisionase family DNA binding protein